MVHLVLLEQFKKLTGIDIDYYVKINFRGVVDLVNALGGVTVNVEEPDFDYDSQATIIWYVNKIVIDLMVKMI